MKIVCFVVLLFWVAGIIVLMTPYPILISHFFWAVPAGWGAGTAFREFVSNY